VQVAYKNATAVAFYSV